MARDTSPTERRGYERPPIGDDWADAWDGLVEDSDELAVERGPIADRPSTGAYDDALYLAVDQRTLWRWDAAASDWEAAAGLGTASDPVPGTSHFESLSTGAVSSFAANGATVEVQTSQSIPNATVTTVEFDTAKSDPNGNFDTSSSFSYSVPVNGDYLVTAVIALAGLTDGDDFNLIVDLNGSNQINFESNTAASENEYISGTTILKGLSAGDNISIEVFHNGGSGVATTVGNENSASFQQIA